MIFLRNHKNCSKKRPPAKMQASHRRRRECRTLANTRGNSRISPATTAIFVTRTSSRSRRGLRKQDSSYGPRGRSLGRRGQASVTVNLPDHPAQSITLDMLYPMHFAHLLSNMHSLRHVGDKGVFLCWPEHFAVELYIFTYNQHHTVKSLCSTLHAHRVFCG
ncbi:hypothetical protein TNCV_2854091 [Trichonephila clavipes]|uniref:Uncharacterized protein n=1 Tax=Trichonephila clavipes TaxID=2585209 RepID=A0A8X6R7U0_TRICX|nr:hypothetical protein TNCV_2854091 [Trichonephila clavipes]